MIAAGSFYPTVFVGIAGAILHVDAPWVPAVLFLGLVALLLTARNLKRTDFITLTPDGLRPSRFSSVVIPFDQIDRFEMRYWNRVGGRTDDTEAHVAVCTTAGNVAILPGLEIPMKRTTEPCHLLASTSNNPRWGAVIDGYGRRSRWTLRTNERTMTFLASRVKAFADRRLGEHALSPVSTPSSAPLDFGRLRSTGGLEDLRRVEYGKLPPRRVSDLVVPPERPVKRPTAASRDAAAAATQLLFPVALGSRASSRVSALPFTHRVGVEFGEGGVTLRSKDGPELVPYEAIDRIDLDVLDDNRWHLALLMADGDARELPGMMHGQWATSPMLVGNELQWTGTAEAECSERSAGAPAEISGSMPWGTDDDDLVIARLNALLEYARTRASSTQVVGNVTPSRLV